MSPIALFDLGGLAATKEDNDEEKKEMASAVTITTLRSPNSFNSISRSTSNANLLLTNSTPFSDVDGKDNNRHGTITPRTFAEPLSLAALYIPPGFDVTVFDKAEESVKYLVYTNTWKSFVGDMSDETAVVLEGEVMRGRAVRERRKGASRGGGGGGGGSDKMAMRRGDENGKEGVEMEIV